MAIQGGDPLPNRQVKVENSGVGGLQSMGRVPWDPLSRGSREDILGRGRGSSLQKGERAWFNETRGSKAAKLEPTACSTRYGRDRGWVGRAYQMTRASPLRGQRGSKRASWLGLDSSGRLRESGIGHSSHNYRTRDRRGRMRAATQRGTKNRSRRKHSPAVQCTRCKLQRQRATLEQLVIGRRTDIMTGNAQRADS